MVPPSSSRVLESLFNIHWHSFAPWPRASLFSVRLSSPSSSANPESRIPSRNAAPVRSRPSDMVLICCVTASRAIPAAPSSSSWTSSGESSFPSATVDPSGFWTSTTCQYSAVASSKATPGTFGSRLARFKTFTPLRLRRSDATMFSRSRSSAIDPLSGAIRLSPSMSLVSSSFQSTPCFGPTNSSACTV